MLAPELFIIFTLSNSSELEVSGVLRTLRARRLVRLVRFVKVLRFRKSMNLIKQMRLGNMRQTGAPRGLKVTRTRAVGQLFPFKLLCLHRRHIYIYTHICTLSHVSQT